MCCYIFRKSVPNIIQFYGEFTTKSALSLLKVSDPRRNHPREFTVKSVNRTETILMQFLSFWHSRDKDRRDREKEKNSSSSSSKEKDVKQEKSTEIKTEVKQEEN